MVRYFEIGLWDGEEISVGALAVAIVACSISSSSRPDVPCRYLAVVGGRRGVVVHCEKSSLGWRRRWKIPSPGPLCALLGKFLALAFGGGSCRSDAEANEPGWLVLMGAVSECQP